LTINDDSNGSCITTITVDPPTDCSDPCELSIVNIDLVCDDNGTITDPSDDFYAVTITSTASNPGSNNQYEVLVDALSFGIFTHGSDAEITIPANGNSPNIIVQDIDWTIG